MNKDNAKDYLPLVQALAEGRVIQWRNHADSWEDSGELSDAWGAENYRIKPEPREIWVNRIAPNGDSGWFHSEEAVRSAYLHSDPVRYREVIE